MNLQAEQMTKSHDASDMVRRIENANRQRFAGRPVYAIGDVLQPLVPVVEGVWSNNGRTIIDTSADVSDPDTSVIGANYTVRVPGKVWYILYLAPALSSAGRAWRHLGRLGYQVYWPREVVVAVRGRGEDRKLVPLVRPLFTGYALLHAPKNIAPEDLVGSPQAKASGISGLVSVAKQPIVVADVIVERVIERERSGEFDHTDRSGRKVIPKMLDWLIEGGLVIVNTGPFREFAGVIEEIDRDRQRLKVAVNVFGRATPIDLDLADVRKP